MGKWFILFILTLCGLFTMACYSVDKHVFENPSTPVSLYFNTAQNLSDKHDYNNALIIYDYLLKRKNITESIRLQAQYEVAFIHYQQKDYVQAKEEFKKIIRTYQALTNPDPKSTFAQKNKWVFVLSGTLLQQMDPDSSS